MFQKKLRIMASTPKITFFDQSGSDTESEKPVDLGDTPTSPPSVEASEPIETNEPIQEPAKKKYPISRCAVDGCDKYIQNGYPTCVSHGAKIRKLDVSKCIRPGCDRNIQYVPHNLCHPHFRETFPNRFKCKQVGCSNVEKFKSSGMCQAHHLKHNMNKKCRSCKIIHPRIYKSGLSLSAFYRMQVGINGDETSKTYSQLTTDEKKKLREDLNKFMDSHNQKVEEWKTKNPEEYKTCMSLRNVSPKTTKIEDDFDTLLQSAQAFEERLAVVECANPKYYQSTLDRANDTLKTLKRHKRRFKTAATSFKASLKKFKSNHKATHDELHAVIMESKWNTFVTREFPDDTCITLVVRKGGDKRKLKNKVKSLKVTEDMQDMMTWLYTKRQNWNSFTPKIKYDVKY
ncbi:MAG: hypothetical protein ACTSUE_22740 [Promethearchaeota archaeon]